MPLEYIVVHSQRLVIAVARGSIIAEEVIAFTTKIDAENAHTLRQARVFASAAGAARLIRVFEDQTGARRWLDELGGHA